MDKIDTLKNKFDRATDVDWMAQQSKETPDRLFPVVFRAKENFNTQSLPEGIRIGCSMGAITTARATFDQILNLGENPGIISLTIR